MNMPLFGPVLARRLLGEQPGGNAGENPSVAGEGVGGTGLSQAPAGGHGAGNGRADGGRREWFFMA